MPLFLALICFAVAIIFDWFRQPGLYRNSLHHAAWEDVKSVGRTMAETNQEQVLSEKEEQDRRNREKARKAAAAAGVTLVEDMFQS